MRWLNKLHLLAGAVPLLFLAIALSLAAKSGFQPTTETYPRVRYRPALAAETIVGMWQGGFRKPMPANKRIVAIWGLADHDEQLSAESSGVALAEKLSAAGASVQIFDPRWNAEHAHQLLPNASFHQDMYSASTGATDLVINSDLEVFHKPDFGLLRKSMKGKIIFDCVVYLDASQVKDAGFAHFPIGGHGWPPWLDSEFQSFVKSVKEKTPSDARILLLPMGPLTTTSPRARWYLLLNYALAPRALLLAGPHNASGTAPQYQQWVKERNRQGLLRDAGLQQAINESKADWILWFKQSADFTLSDWSLEEIVE